MSQDEDVGVAVEIEGLPLEEAVDALVGTVGHDREEIRTTLQRVTEDGVVTESGVEDALSDVSTVVATAENRAEFAAIELDDAREAAGDATDVAVVASRLDAFESRLESVEERVERLDAALQSVVGHTGDVSYAVVRDLRRLRSRARDVQLAADELYTDAESFQRWVTTPAARHEEFEEDVTAVEDALDGLEAEVDELDLSADDDDVATVWLDATLRHRLTGLLIADLRTEFEDLRTLAARQDDDPPEAGDRLDGLETRREAVGERLDGLARPDWRERFGGEVAGFEDVLASYEPPVDWAEVYAELDDHRPSEG